MNHFVTNKPLCCFISLRKIAFILFLLGFGINGKVKAASTSVSGVGVSVIEITPSTLNSEGWLQVSEVVATETGTGNNLALSTAGATATGSSNWPDSSPNYSIDGVAPNSFPHIFHSNENITPFLRIKLAYPSQLDSIKLFGRTDCCSFRDIYNIRLYDSKGILLYSINDLDATASSHSVVAGATAELEAKVRRIEAEHQAQEEREELARQAKREAKIQKFRKNIKPGDDTTDGVVIEVKGNLIKIQTEDSQCTQRDYDGNCRNRVSETVEKWFKRSEVYPRD